MINCEVCRDRGFVFVIEFVEGTRYDIMYKCNCRMGNNWLMCKNVANVMESKYLIKPMPSVAEVEKQLKAFAGVLPQWMVTKILESVKHIPPF